MNEQELIMWMLSEAKNCSSAEELAQRAEQELHGNFLELAQRALNAIAASQKHGRTVAPVCPQCGNANLELLFTQELTGYCPSFTVYDYGAVELEYVDEEVDREIWDSLCCNSCDWAVTGEDHIKEFIRTNASGTPNH